MRILAFDTSNQPLSVAVVEDDRILAEQLINVKRNHSVQLMPIIDEMLRQAKVSLDDIDRIAVAQGPGSYTGLRIAVTIAKTLAWTKDIELVGVSSLKVIAGNRSDENTGEMILPIFDARRQNIYTGLYTRKKDGELVKVMDEVHVAAEQWAQMLAQKEWPSPLTLIGVDAPKFFEIFQEKLGDQVRLARPEQFLPRASVLAFLAQNEEVTSAHSFTPTYLKLAEAEENWLKEHPDFEGGNWVEKI